MPWNAPAPPTLPSPTRGEEKGFEKWGLIENRQETSTYANLTTLGRQSEGDVAIERSGTPHPALPHKGGGKGFEKGPDP